MAGYQGAQLQALDRCRLALKLIFISDIATACGRFLDERLLLDPQLPDGKVLQFVFPNERPGRTDWKLWYEFWMAFSGPGGHIPIPLGDWQYPTHCCWEWFYNVKEDQILHKAHEAGVTVYARSDEGKQLRSGQLYQQSHLTDQVPACSIPANVLELSKEKVLCREISPRLAPIRSLAVSFWELLRSLGRDWIWEDVKEGDTDVEWVRDALINGTFIGVTEGSYNRKKAKTVSGTGWIIVCRSVQRTLRFLKYQQKQAHIKENCWVWLLSTPL
jgi:hypothetical protein